MSSNLNVSQNEAENTCVVCFKNVDIYSVGVCDHPVCYECSTRMRVLCKQNECPICRQDMPKVIFTREVDLFTSLMPRAERTNLQERKIGILFCTSGIQRAYYGLLEHQCPICVGGRSRKWPFRTFHELKDHMRREHELFYCELCVANLKIFTFERRCYTRSELALHRRKGDADNTSHRGHPLCEFCDVRYMDNDELFRHLRREHLYCHFCDADGKHQYYNSYSDLRRHFLDDHYVCEEGECKNEQFTSVFRSDIDLKAHITNKHSKYMSKSATKQARTLEVKFRFRGDLRGDVSDDDLEGAVGCENYYMEPGGYRNGPSNVTPFVDLQNSTEFPVLGNSNEALPAQSNRVTSSVTFTKYTSKPFRAEDFPSLGSRSGTGKSSNVTITASGKVGGGSKGVISGKAPEVTIKATRRPQSAEDGASASNSKLQFSISNNSKDRPQSSRPNVSIHVTRITSAPPGTNTQFRPPKSSAEAFPALSSAPIPEAQWVQQKPKKQQESSSKAAAKVNPAPQLPPSSLDFPALSKNIKANDQSTKTKKRSSVTMPVSNSWVNLNSFNSENSAKNSARKDNKTNNSEASSENSKKIEQNRTNHSNPYGEVPNVAKISENSRSNESAKTKKKKQQHKNVEHHENKVNKSADELYKNYSAQSDPASKNGIVKKVSHLKIDPVSNDDHPTQNGLLTEGFPALGNSLPTTGKKPPPPGFNPKPPPPPGFDNRSPSNDLTFTNSSGQSYSILPAHSSYDYHMPPNFEHRNKKLIDSFMNVVHDGDAIREFKLFSDMFRNGTYSARNFYENCKHFMGDEFGRIFPELLVLLPDIEKQQELYKVHTEDGAKPQLDVCRTCQQVVLVRDLRHHLTNHTLENNFPILQTETRDDAFDWLRQHDARYSKNHWRNK